MRAQEMLTRGNLPHWFVPGAAHFVTYRLAGTLPRDVLERLRDEHGRLLREAEDGPAGRGLRERIHKRFFGRYDDLLDRDTSVAHLANPDVAALIRENLYHHASRYHLLAYCVMPNHVHVLLQPREAEGSTEDRSGRPVGETPDGPSPLSAIMHSLKSYTAHQANRILGRSGVFWQRESYDHWVRDEEELERIVAYIVANPVKAGLVERARDWVPSSAYDRYQLDGNEEGWLLGFDADRTR